MKDVLGILFLMSFVWTLGYAHGDLDQRIISATQSITADPENKDLYFHRGKLYYQHEEYNKGVLDIQTAIDKGYQNEQANLYLSKCHFELEEYNKAEAQIHIFFSKDPNHVIAHNLFGKILYKKKEYTQSATEFQYVIDHAVKPLPENYINAANSWVELKSEKGISEAVKIIQKGLSDQGQIISLQQHLIKILIDVHQYDQALLVQKSIIDSKNRKETAYYTLYEIADAKGDSKLAKDALENAEKSWNQLPTRIKQNSAMVKLNSHIKNNLIKLTSTNSK